MQTLVANINLHPCLVLSKRGQVLFWVTNSVYFICVGVNVAKPVSNNISKFPFFGVKVSIDGLRAGPRWGYLGAANGPGCLTLHPCVPCLGQISLNQAFKEELRAQGRCKVGCRVIKYEACKVATKACNNGIFFPVL